MKKKTTKPKKKKSKYTCPCGEPAMYFHSKCCCAHFEGVINPDGTPSIVCETCGKFVADIKGKLKQ